ncbi:hypothetical protein HMPREF1984_01261 [Leptotrichia sp. oral taxon 215 str. W9775]|nr:hypothetical protein HMPREF1984_01261 [Leptotrichia sp. oral taxon 215 str. W9775]
MGIKTKSIYQNFTHIKQQFIKEKSKTCLKARINDFFLICFLFHNIKFKKIQKYSSVI